VQTLMQFRPVSDTEWWFLGVTLACTVLAFRFLPRVYERGPAVAVGAANFTGLEAPARIVAELRAELAARGLATPSAARGLALGG